MNPTELKSVVRSPQSIPVSAGIGLRAQHHEELLRDAPSLSWLEAHSENYFAAGGAQIDTLLQLRERYRLSLHGVGLSLGSADPLNKEHLSQLKRLIDLTNPGLTSEHLCWGSVDGTFMNDLLPLPYTNEALQHMIDRISAVQDYLGRQILIENVSSYLQFKDSVYREADFLVAMADASGCGLLLDVNNVYVSSRNHGFDAQKFIAAIPAYHVHEFHLAGHTVNRHNDREILIDTHSDRVCDDVWSLFDYAIRHVGPRPTLIEWDTDIPSLNTLLAEAAKADFHMESSRALAA